MSSVFIIKVGNQCRKLETVLAIGMARFESRWSSSSRKQPRAAEKEVRATRLPRMSRRDRAAEPERARASAADRARHRARASNARAGHRRAGVQLGAERSGGGGQAQVSNGWGLGPGAGAEGPGLPANPRLSPSPHFFLLPGAGAATKDIVRVAAIGDLHFGRTTPPGSLQPLFAQIAESADVLVIAGDLTDYGLVDEARAFVKELASAKVPIVAVLGNHDYESNQQDDIATCLKDAGIAVLDGETTEIHGIGFAGVKGFAGGFGRRALAPWGEEIIKKFVHEAVNEALKLESALARLRNDHIVAILHYARFRRRRRRRAARHLSVSRLQPFEDSLTRFPLSAVVPRPRITARLKGARARTSPSSTSAALMRERFLERPYQLVEVGATRPASGDRRGGADRRAAISRPDSRGGGGRRPGAI